MKNRFSLLPTNSLPVVIVFSATALFLGGCGKTEIETYRVAKEDNQPPPTSSAPHGGMERPAVPHVHGDVPAGWNERQAEGMRVASYQITGPEGRMAEVAVIPLPGKTNIELESINMWRAELGLPALNSDQLKTTGQEIPIGDAKGTLVDMTAESAGPKGITRTIGALANRGDIMWFIKLTGESKLVGDNKDKFVSFLKSLNFHEGGHDQGTQVAANTPPAPSVDKPISSNAEKAPANAAGPNFKVPQNWTEKAPGPMVQRAFTVTGDGGQAEMTITKFPGDVGGMVGNVNRWRGQLGLAPLSDAEAKQGVEMVEIDGRKDSYLVDVKGTNARTGKSARLVAIGVPHQGETWFFKLLGDESVVAKEKDAFLRFVVSAY